MAIVDCWLNQAGADTNTGLTSAANAVKSFQRANSVMAAIGGGGDTPRLRIGRYNLIATGAGGATSSTWNPNFNTTNTQRGLGNYTNNGLLIDGVTQVTVTVPAGVLIVPDVPSQDVHISYIRTTGTTVGEWTRLGWDAATKTFTAGGAILTNIWVTADLVNNFARDLGIYRVWKGALANGLSAKNPDNEIFEATNLLDMGSAPDRMWTGREYPAAAATAGVEWDWTTTTDSITVTASNVGGDLVFSTAANSKRWSPYQAVRFASTGVLPTGIAAATDYYLTPVPGSLVQYRVSGTYVLALAGTYIAYVDAGTPTISMALNTPNAAMLGRKLFVYCVGNPAKVWGGVSFQTAEANHGGLYLKCMTDVSVSPDLKFLGQASSYGAGTIDGCTRVLWEAQHDATSWRNVTLAIRSDAAYGATSVNTDITIAPAMDSCSSMNTPASVNSGQHSYGNSDMIGNDTGTTVINGFIKFVDKASNGRRSYFRQPRHTAINLGAVSINRFIVEPGVQFIGGAHPYQRAYSMGGTGSTNSNWILGGEITGMSAPSQLCGSGIIFGMTVRGQRSQYTAQPGGTTIWMDKWGRVRGTNGGLDTDIAKFREPAIQFWRQGSSSYQTILIINSDFECLGHATQLYDTIGGGSPTITFTQNVFRASPGENPGQEPTFRVAIAFEPGAFNAGNYVRCINNVTIGDVTGATTIGAATTTYALPDMTIGGVLGAAGFAINTGWVNYATTELYDRAQASARGGANP
jgi:hypothetical protein